MSNLTRSLMLGGGASWTDSTGTALRRPDGSLENLSGGGFRPGALLGDSITGQHAAYGSGTDAVGNQGPWNWANWLVGAPFDLDFVSGVSGAVAVDIFSRTWLIPPNINAVFVLAGTNDILAVSSVANSGVRDAAVASITGTIAAGLADLKARGKTVAIATIPPNNAYTAGDSRIDVLDRVNAYIATLPSLGLAYKVLDLFTACWDSAAPTTRVYKTNHSSDGTHLTNVGGQAGGLAFIQEMKAMYAATSGVSTLFDTALFPTEKLSTMRVINGLSSTISTGGSGTASTDMAGGWRSLRQSGTPTWVCSIEDRTAPANWVGPMAGLGVGEKMQKYVITAGATGDIVRTQLNSQLTANSSTGISYGDAFAVGIDLQIESPVSMNGSLVQGIAYVQNGTSPADQNYGGSTSQNRTYACASSVSGTDYAYPSGFRAFVRSRRVRIGENVNGTVGVTLQLFTDLSFNAAGSVTARLGRPLIWRWTS